MRLILWLSIASLPLFILRSEKEWRQSLGPERYRVMREGGTEKAFSGEHLRQTANGIYLCAACNFPLFRSEDKYEEPYCGWPTFSQPANKESVVYQEDWKLPFKRYEVLCRNCGSHLGHVFPDGPPPKNLRFTINSITLIFNPMPTESVTETKSVKNL